MHLAARAVAAAGIAGSMILPAAAEGGLGWIELRVDAARTSAIAHVVRIDDRVLDAELSAERLDGTNTVRSKQSSPVPPGSGTHVVGQMQVSTGEGSRLRLVLTVRDDAGIVSISTITTGAAL